MVRFLIYSVARGLILALISYILDSIKYSKLLK